MIIYEGLRFNVKYFYNFFSDYMSLNINRSCLII